MAEFMEFDWRNSANNFGYGESIVKRKGPTDKEGALRELRDLVDASIDLALRDKSKCQDDKFLQKFLYARKHDSHEAFRLLINYYSYRQRNPELFREISPKDEGVAMALADGLPGVLTQRDRRGRCIVVMFASNWSPALYSLIVVYRALLLTLEKALDDIQNQANGFVIVVDWTEFTFKQSSNMNPKILKLMIEGLQDCFPAKFKGIHFIAQPWYVETALTVIKPFLKGKTKERIFLHGNNLSTLHEYLSRDVLPSDLGGEGPSHNTEDWLAKICPPGPDSCLPTPKIIQNNKHQDDYFEKAKINKGYQKQGGFIFTNNNGFERSAKTQLLNGEEEH